jgi:hypothetical protein
MASTNSLHRRIDKIDTIGHPRVHYFLGKSGESSAEARTRYLEESGEKIRPGDLLFCVLHS